MIKVKVNNEYKDVVKIFCGGTLQKEIIKVWSREAQEYVYESSVEYTGSLPIAISANGDALLDYRIYGADGGVGEPTENLCGALIPNIAIISSNGVAASSMASNSTDYIPIETTSYVITIFGDNVINSNSRGVAYYDENKNFISGFGWDGFTTSKRTETITVSSQNIKYIRFTVDKGVTKVMFVESSIAPTNYIPYGYKLPMAVQSENLFDINEHDTSKGYIANAYLTANGNILPYSQFMVSVGTKEKNVYIGENQLDAIGEYMDYVDKASEKIVRKIVKIEFNGSEEWKNAGSIGSGRFYITVENGINSVWGSTHDFSKCSHYTPSADSHNVGEYNLGGLTHVPSTRWNQNIVFNTGISSINEFKSYLYSQYEDGTPVTIWYVAEIPVEQDPPVPLPEIPTINGETIIDYDGDPKPSQMYVKYRR